MRTGEICNYRGAAARGRTKARETATAGWAGARASRRGRAPSRRGNRLQAFRKSCVKLLTLPWRGYESTVALNVQRSWGGGIERDRARVNVWHSNATVPQYIEYLLQASASVSNE
ncbi:hypothetical protein EVAR_36083_1 [Eumeta japonica]|uniref:Uncharacterized protein n=1 Tax=Eumeta variegata TaxID=151549 RepID=A0A4C1YFR0_EUMVA|nr:hypothetical protein EVAR_36083_1 [Eumeta japonica]